SAIKELPHGYRTIFLLHEVEGYEHQEIAEVLGCSVGNSKSQLHKAKMRIRELLAQLPKTRSVAARDTQSSTKPVRPSVEAWGLPIDQYVAMQPASNISQLVASMPDCDASLGH